MIGVGGGGLRFGKRCSCGDANHYFSPFSDLVWLAILAAILRNAGIYKLTRVIKPLCTNGVSLEV